MTTRTLAYIHAAGAESCDPKMRVERFSLYATTAGLRLAPQAAPHSRNPWRRSEMGMTDTQRETAARLLAETMVSTEWRDLRPFTRAKYRNGGEDQ